MNQTGQGRPAARPNYCAKTIRIGANRMSKVLVSDPIADAGIEYLRGLPGVQVDVRLGLKPDELKAIIGEYDALAVRSETKVTAEILAAAERLQIIGRA